MEAGGQVILIQLFPALVGIVDGINEGTLEPAKGEVQVGFLHHGPGEVEGIVPLVGPFIDRFSGWIIDPEHPANFVVGFPDRVVPGFTDDLVLMLPRHVNQFGVPA